jgi:uroporphyrinogen decarboxylase
MNAPTSKVIVARFNDRVNSALRTSTPSKAWVRKALHHEGAPRCPVRLRNLSYDVILRHGDALADLFVAYPDDIVEVIAYEPFVGFQLPGQAEPIDAVQALTEEAKWIDEWGTQWGHAAGGVGAHPITNPITDWSQLDGYLSHPMPDPRGPERVAGAKPMVEMLGPTKYVVGATPSALWERLYFLRGMENAFEDFYASPGEVDRLLGALTDFIVEIIPAWGRLGNVDAFLTSDDWGSQMGLMISPEMWRRFFAGHYRRICEEAHRHDLTVEFHSCGNIGAIIGDLIDAGVDVIDPLQSEALDLGWVAREFGGKVAFQGGLPEQTLPGLTPTQVRDEVRRLIDLLGGPFGNAYILAPSNAITADVPLANLAALFEASHDQ